MYRTGHYGVTLLAYAPVGFLLAAGGRPAVAVLAGLGALAVTPLPDFDHRMPGVSHRGVTHTLLFAVAVGAVLAWATRLLPAGTVAPRVTALAFGVGVFGVGAHLLGDVLTPAGVPLLWPLSDRRVTLAVASADSLVANYGLFALGVAATAAAASAAFQLPV